MNHYGPLLRMLHCSTNQVMTAALEEMELTAAQGHIMGYLAHCKTPPCSRDIENTFHLTHPTVSGLLSRLEKKGFIEIRTDETDRRIRRIHILDKGRECMDTMHRTILSIERQIVEGFSPEEQEQFLTYLRRAQENMGCADTHAISKEENDT